MAGALRRLLPCAKNGSLRFWGHWFGGRPGENFHQIIDSDPTDDVLREIAATGADTVAVSCPFCLQMFEEGISSRGAQDVRQAKDLIELLDDNTEAAR
jgi:Fe-S oxidoreductase